MFVATITVSVLLAVLLAFSAIMKLSHRDEVVAAYGRVGVPEERLNHLAAILLAGAGGLVAGLFWAPIGVAAAIGLVVYFALAIAAHLKFDDRAHLPTPLMMEALAAAALILRLATL